MSEDKGATGPGGQPVTDGLLTGAGIRCKMGTHGAAILLNQMLPEAPLMSKGGNKIKKIKLKLLIIKVI